MIGSIEKLNLEELDGVKYTELESRLAITNNDLISDAEHIKDEIDKLVEMREQEISAIRERYGVMIAEHSTLRLRKLSGASAVAEMVMRSVNKRHAESNSEALRTYAKSQERLARSLADSVKADKTAETG